MNIRPNVNRRSKKPMLIWKLAAGSKLVYSSMYCCVVGSIKLAKREMILFRIGMCKIRIILPIRKILANPHLVQFLCKMKYNGR
jgi:hypothetical protein